MISQTAHKAPSYKTMTINSPGSGGLNIQDLEFDLSPEQSSDLMNMMIKNGAFGKRYGQQNVHTFGSTIHAIGKYQNTMVMHVGTKIVKYVPETDTVTDISTGISDKRGLFINYNKLLYYLCDKYYQYDGTTWSDVIPYAPDVCINRKPDGSYSDLIEDYNRLGAAFKNTFNGDGTSKVYKLTQTALDDVTPVIEVNTAAVTAFTWDKTAGTVTFSTAPSTGQNNVVITAYKTDQTYIDSVLNCIYSTSFGGQSNSRLFLAGNGNAIYYFSDVFDASYFPESNYAVLGNGEEDITGFGNQYEVLVVFKPSELYAISYYYDKDENGNQTAMFSSALISKGIGCDMPDTIRYIDNKLTWGSTAWGICILVQTLIQNERNVIVVSRNINGGDRSSGLLQETNLKSAKAMDFEGKYIVKVNSNCYVWDYQNAPYYTSSSKTTDFITSTLAWFKWKNINFDSSLIMNRKAYYIYGNKINMLNNKLNDFGAAIEAYYMTPMFMFGAEEYLKTIKRIYIQTRGDTPALINMKYITEDDPVGEIEQDPIHIYSKLWKDFTYPLWGWRFITFANTFSRKCSIKKVQMFGVLFSNNEIDKDISISAIIMQYLIVKAVK